MYQDPDMTWDGEFPYDVLAPAGITPDSSRRQVLGAIKYFTQRQQGGNVQRAWKMLRISEERLFFDFFLYRAIHGAEAEDER